MKNWSSPSPYARWREQSSLFAWTQKLWQSHAPCHEQESSWSAPCCYSEARLQATVAKISGLNLGKRVLRRLNLLEGIGVVWLNSREFLWHQNTRIFLPICRFSLWTWWCEPSLAWDCYQSPQIICNDSLGASPHHNENDPTADVFTGRLFWWHGILQLCPRAVVEDSFNHDFICWWGCGNFKPRAPKAILEHHKVSKMPFNNFESLLSPKGRGLVFGVVASEPQATLVLRGPVPEWTSNLCTHVLANEEDALTPPCICGNFHDFYLLSPWNRWQGFLKRRTRVPKFTQGSLRVKDFLKRGSRKGENRRKKGADSLETYLDPFQHAGSLRVKDSLNEVTSQNALPDSLTQVTKFLKRWTRVP